MKTKHLLFSLLLILFSILGINKGFSQIVISGYLANPAGTDGSYEYVQLIATENIDFTTDPHTVAWCNNGTGTVKGWVNGGALTYGFNLDSGSVAKGDVFYVGGAMKKIDGSGSTDISGAKWMRAKYTATQPGDGFGALGAGGSLGNGGGNADGIAVFVGSATSLDSSSIPIDVVFFGTGVGSAKPVAGAVYTIADNDRYSTGFGKFGDTGNTYLYPDVATLGNYFRLKGTYNVITNTWDTSRTASSVLLSVTSILTDISTEITLFTPAPSVTITALPFLGVNVIQNSNNNPLYHFTCDVTLLPATLDSMNFTTFGSYYSGDIKSNGFKLWYSNDAIFSTADSLIDFADATGPGSLLFKNISFQIPVYTTAHFFVTADIASGANLGDSIYIDSLMLSDVYFASATKKGANPQSSGGVLTVISSSSPVINVSTLAAFSKQIINTTSAEKMYNISGGNLFPATGNIIITPPAGFEISFTSGSGFTDTFLTLPYTLGSINPTDVYVVFKPTVIKTYTDNITHVGGNTFQNLPVSGDGISPDIIPPKADTAFAVDVNTVTVNFNEAVDTTAELTQNYVILGGVASAVRDPSLKVVTLTLTSPLFKGVPRNLTIENISDTCSNHNIMNPPKTFQLFIPAELVINEVLAKSVTSDDFIEIYNPNITKSIGLLGWHLTNDSASLTKWAFPDTSIKAGGYLVVWDNQHPANAGLHCNFTLNNAAGEIALRSNSNVTIAYSKFPAAKSDTSWGRMPNGYGSFTYTKLTPGAANQLYPIPPKPIPTYSIAQIRTNSPTGVPDSVGVYCKVIGIVYGVNFSAFGYSFTVIDNTAGINMYKSNTTIIPPYTVKEGDKIRVIGKVLPTYYGLTEFGIDSIVRLDSNQTLVSPLIVTTLNETIESKLVRLENLRLTDIDTALWPKIAGTSAINVRAYNTSDTFMLRIHFKCDLQGTPRPLGKFNINGLGNQYALGVPYDTGYQIWPRYKADLTIITDIQPTANTLGLELYPNPNNGQFVIINPSSTKLNISVLNTLGEVLSDCVSSQSRITINITNGKGLYFVKAVAPNGQTSIIKVVVK